MVSARLTTQITSRTLCSATMPIASIQRLVILCSWGEGLRRERGEKQGTHRFQEEGDAAAIGQLENVASGLKGTMGEA